MRSDYHPSAGDLQLVAVLHACGTIITSLTPSAMTRHFRILRESGLVRTEPHGTSKFLTLRREDLDARFPGLLDSVLRVSGEG